jgi:hypothetical protein
VRPEPRRPRPGRRTIPRPHSPRDVGRLEVYRHAGWTPEERRKIDAYARQPDLFNAADRAPLEAPRFKAAYRYRCHDARCSGHRQHIIDWEFVLLQRRLSGYTDAGAIVELRQKFLDQMCASDRDVAFYVGNQAKRVHVFSVLGVYWPRRGA